MAFGNEADEIRALGKLLEKGYVYRGLKPVNWCFDCGSALAEAEVEYENKRDPSIDVGFPFVGGEENAKIAKAFGLDKLPLDKGYCVIWTTTPWTIPSNQALNMHPEITYALVKTERDATHEGFDRYSPVYLGDYVSTETGTGVVHSAPSYGIEDFQSCKAHGMKDADMLNPVMGDGRYASWLPFFAGMTIWEASKPICDKLREAGTLFSLKMFDHSYMHCWRHKTPIIYRATSQWFASMDNAPKTGGASLRETALAAIDQTAFYPSWGKARLHGMIANRPDWTLSRQRQWGVPMAFLLHKETGALHPRTSELLETIAQRVAKEGIEAWQNMSVEELIGDEAAMYEKNRDTLDVWFDSGATHFTVLRGSHKEQSAYPADLYLEGSDQHRGWFHSSLLTASMLDGHAPYKALLTHGFVVDGEGKKMSKSKGNVIAPQKVFDTLGADILRLWVASTDYSGELSISDEILKRVTEAYRRIRNTLRFLLANTSDFDFSKDAVATNELLEIDQYAIAHTAALQKEILAHYDAFEFHPVISKLQSFCSEDLGGFYLDILKDPEEAWQSFASAEAFANSDETIFTQTYYELPTIANSEALEAKYASLRAVRADVTKQLEE
eukprot:gene34391-biopygen12809